MNCQCRQVCEQCNQEINEVVRSVWGVASLNQGELI